MPKTPHLTAKAVDKIRYTGRHAIGGGVYLVITENGSRQYWARGDAGDGRRRWRVLGAADTLTIAEARATAARALTEAAEAVRPDRHIRTFLEAANAFTGDRKGTWKSKAHRQGWENSIAHLKPLHRLPVDKISARDVAAALIPLQNRPETLARTRGRVEAIIDAEMVGAGITDHPNPATLRIQRHLVPALAPAQRRKARKAVVHHAALTLEDTRALWARIPNTKPGRALRLTILTACRTSEIRLAQWKHFDPVARTLTIPVENTKTDIDHVVPLTAAALAVMGKTGKPDAFIFTHARDGSCLSQDAMRMTLRRLGVEGDEGTVHGFRSTFRDWTRAEAKDETIAELCLGHQVGDEVTRAYARDTAPQRRRTLLEEWSDAVTLAPTTGNVTPIRGAR